MLTLTLPWPPTVNTYYRRKGDRFFISERGVYYRGEVKKAVPRPLGLLLGPIGILIYAHPPDRRKRDIDNILKSLIDSLMHAKVFADDSQVEDLHIVRCPIILGGVLHVHIDQVGEKLNATK